MVQINRANDWTWFGVLSPTKGFVFTIGAVPIRFYRGVPNNPPQTTLADRHDELRQLSLAFGASDLGELKWRFSIETDRFGYPTSVLFVGHAADGRVECYWPIPFAATVTSLPVPSYEAPREVDLPAPLSGGEVDKSVSGSIDR